MTQAFISFWKQKSGCETCASTPGKTMCQACRKRALKKWHSYVLTRLAKNLCIQCPRKQQPGEQRCEECAERNRENCVRYYYRVKKGQVLKAIASGICARCLKRPARPGQRKCNICRDLTNAAARGEVRPTRPYLCFT